MKASLPPFMRPRPIGALTAAGLLLAVCAAPCTAATNAIPGRVLHFNMDEVRNGALLELITSNTLGRVTNARTTSNGKLAGACEFGAKNSYVQIPDAPALNPKRLTMALWFKSGKEAKVSRYLLEKGTERGYALSIAGGGKENTRKGKLRATVNGHDCLSDNTVTDDLWHHAAATFDGQTLKLYVDGILQKQTVAVKGELAANAHDLTLGMHRSAPSSQDKEVSFEGLLDEVVIFNRALDEAEIKRLRSSAKPKFTKWQVERRIKELNDLLARGLILQDFYDRKMEECEVVE
jgi:hypothetical protein